MSNNAVGSLYSSVIEGVLSHSMGDFEDSGIDQQTIQELRNVWQEKLSALKVATMPWDPEPVKEEQPTNASTTNNLTSNSATPSTATPATGTTTAAAAAAAPLLPDSKAASSATTNGGGLVLPGAGITQTDGSSGNDVPLTRQQIDEIIKLKAENTNRIELIRDEQSRIILQTDGAASDQSDDINSDLDDPEDELASGDEDDDDEQGMIMLCLYDKVQRVKNKWKYVLKDGIANINGKDYVFSKGSGESEW